jgi:hypothetical protein
MVILLKNIAGTLEKNRSKASWFWQWIGSRRNGGVDFYTTYNSIGMQGPGVVKPFVAGIATRQFCVLGTLSAMPASNERNLCGGDSRTFLTGRIV